MPVTWFTADSHFHHAGMMSERMHSRRSFPSVEAMNEHLIANWNAVVGRGDTVWHLGDFAWKASLAQAQDVFRRLHGRKFLIRGNHDKVGERLPWDAPVRDVAQIHVQDPGMAEPVALWLSHYAHRSWPRQHKGTLHLYGHSHGALPPTGTSLDVGVDAWDLAPVALPQILARLAEAAAREGDAS
ncbi:metallophosphoesterase [Methylobacterium sp. WL12]|uniref:metallophosphoesterase n=1 Tax=Methylobacterium sp. WL12 TaxID=2603890 RepID=UPI0011CBA7E2|nr:metallophosphoesterase [Methylobacterium sp. WL12]TXM65376.1 metallophosphoesterase [Methylobacterium sp. WL12]